MTEGNVGSFSFMSGNKGGVTAWGLVSLTFHHRKRLLVDSSARQNVLKSNWPTHAFSKAVDMPFLPSKHRPSRFIPILCVEPLFNDCETTTACR